MTDEEKTAAPPADSAADPPEDELRDSQDSDAIRALLKRSIDVGVSVSEGTDLLRGVQKKLRQRSKGKFYADGWSTTQSRVNYALIAMLMLVVIGVAYFALGPTGISAK